MLILDDAYPVGTCVRREQRLTSRSRTRGYFLVSRLVHRFECIVPRLPPHSCHRIVETLPGLSEPLQQVTGCWLASARRPRSREAAEGG
jgi:hypothetical protein